MTHQASSQIQNHLEPGERILWSGQPRQGVVLRGSDAFLIPFSLLWGGFAIFWELSVLTQGAPLFFSLWGIPFVVVGVYLIVGRFFVEAKQRERTFYAVTSERVLIVSGVLQRRVKSLALRTLSDVSLTESRDGSGSITFGPSPPFASLFGGMAWPGMQQLYGTRFDVIDNSQKVFKVIRDAQRSAT